MNIFFERFSAAFTNKVCKVLHIKQIKLDHHSPAITVFDPSS